MLSAIAFTFWLTMNLFIVRYIIFNVWNKLSTDCVQASSVNMFKNKIDKYLVKAGYT